MGARQDRDLQHAFFNGVGYESWENIWGIWNQINDRDAEALRRIAQLSVHFSDLLTSPDWEPHTPVVQYGVFASQFPRDKKTLWTIINANNFDVSGPELEFTLRAGNPVLRLWHGTTLTPQSTGGTARLSFDIEAHGYGAILATVTLAAPELQLLQEMHRLAHRPLSDYSHAWHFLPQRLVDVPEVGRAKTIPTGMVKIPPVIFEFMVSGLEIEGGNDVGVDVQMPWEDSPRRQHSHLMQMKSFTSIAIRLLTPITKSSWMRHTIIPWTTITFYSIGRTVLIQPVGMRSP